MSIGKIFLVGTPIGNLEDMTFRAVRILQEVDLIASEDTRHTQKLLSHYDIKTPLTSYHEHNEREKAKKLTRDVLSGKAIAFVSNAGMPGISDPGYRIVQEAIKKDISIEVIPGPTAIESALVLSGLPTDSFVFEGFLPPKSISRKKKLAELAEEERTIVLYESPRRIKEVLEDILELWGERKVVLARELTKIHEEVIRGPVNEVMDLIGNRELKGEIVLLIHGKTKEAVSKDIPLEEQITYYTQTLNITRLEAIKLVAKKLGLPKNKVYKQCMRKENK